MISKVLKMIRYELGFINVADINRVGNLCLMYHGITKQDCGNLNKRHTTAKIFDQQLTRFSKYYSFVSVEDYFQERHKSRKKPLMALTFDDGYENNIDVAMPILKKHNAEATIYVTGLNNTAYPMIWADLLDLTEPHWTKGNLEIDGLEFMQLHGRFIAKSNGQSLRDVIRYSRPDWTFKEALFKALSSSTEEFEMVAPRECWSLLSDNQISMLSSEPLITIGSHGYYHNNLASLSIQSMRDELNLSLEYLRNVTKKNVKHIAFPDGSYNDNVKQACLELGLCFQVAAEGFRTENDPSSDTIINRRGLYNCGRPYSQLSDIYYAST